MSIYRVPFQKRRLVGIPEAPFQYYNSEFCEMVYGARLNFLATNVTSHRGLIPEIERV